MLFLSSCCWCVYYFIIVPVHVTVVDVVLGNCVDGVFELFYYSSCTCHSFIWCFE